MMEPTLVEYLMRLYKGRLSVTPNLVQGKARSLLERSSLRDCHSSLKFEARIEPTRVESLTLIKG